MARKLRYDILRDIRRSKGKTLKDVAQEIGCSVSYLSEIECGIYPFNIFDFLDRLSKAYGLELAVKMINTDEEYDLLGDKP